MKEKVPDYYSILQVQPGVSRQDIKASYRKLMLEHKMHPDLGGDHEAAARINEAYSVLMQSSTRASYNRSYFLQRLANALRPRRESSERNADSEVTPTERPARRADPRIAKTHLGIVHLPGWTEGITVRMRDLSIHGISFYSTVPIPAKQVFTFSDPTLDAEAVAVSCRKSKRSYSVHGKFLRVTFRDESGVLVSTTA